jgi:hypothetical protein
MTAAPSLETAKPPAQRPLQFRIVHLLIAMAVIGGVLGISLNLWRAWRTAMIQAYSSNNLKQISVALHNYHDVYGAFPPAYVLDSAGMRMHSWRVLVSAFVESSSFHSSYNFAEPWNGPNNSQLSLRSRAFEIPFMRQATPNMTNYVAIVGPGTMWPGEKSFAIEDVTDGTSRTLMLVEVRNSNIHWMEPRDLPIEELEAWLDPQHQPTLAGAGESLVAYADGHVEVLPPDVTLARLRALITPAGGD